jgi:hypothetical protein
MIADTDSEASTDGDGDSAKLGATTLQTRRSVSSPSPRDAKSAPLEPLENDHEVNGAHAAHVSEGDTPGAPDGSWFGLSYSDRAAIVGGVGGIAFGYDLGVISGALGSIVEDFDLGPSAEGLAPRRAVRARV